MAGLGEVLDTLGITAGARVLHAGGAASGVYLRAFADLDARSLSNFDFIQMSAAESAKLRALFPHCHYIADPGLLQLDAYDLLILTPALTRIGEVLCHELTAQWAFLLREGGKVITFGIDHTLVGPDETRLTRQTRAIFAPGGSWHDIAPGSREHAEGFQYLMRVQRAPGSSYLTWEALSLADRSAQKQLLDTLDPPTQTWGSLSNQPQFLDFAAVRGASQLVHERLNRLFAARQIRPYRAAIDKLESVLSPPVLAYHRLNLARYTGAPVKMDPALNAILDRLEDAEWLRRPLSLMILDLAVKQRDIPLIEKTAAARLDNAWASIGEALAIGIMRVYLDANATQKARAILETCLAGRTGWRHLKFLDISHRLKQQDALGPNIPEPPATWRAGLTALSADPEIRNAAATNPYLARAIAGLQTIEKWTSGANGAGPRDLIGLRSDTSVGPALMAAIESALRARQGFSLVRLGDGEAYAFPAQDIPGSPSQEEADNIRRERLWWGATPTDEARTDIKARARTCIAEADIVGVPSVYRLLRDLDADPAKFGEHASQRGLAAVISAIARASNPVILTEERCHQILFNKDGLTRLAGLADKVIWVSCWPLDRLKLDISAPQRIVHTPPHVQVETETSPAIVPLCACYRERLVELAEQAGPGTLVLVAAGMAGKLFLHEARKKGAVALDIGAMADYLAGYKTRSAADIL